MKKSLKKLVLIIVVLIMIYAATSCNLPFKIVPNTPEPDTSLQATTPPVPGDATASPDGAGETTSTPEAPGLEDIRMPVVGSILKWVDLSDFVFVPGGEFTMGEDSATPSDHAPAHAVTLGGFWIQQAEVTNQQYAACVQAGACTVPAQEEDTPYWYSKYGKVNYPVVGVTWLQAYEYCDYIEGRLPTEAEWEATARGSQGAAYPWGEEEPNCSLLNYDDCLDPSEPEFVRSYNNGASEFKAMDMAGNVFEWVNDWYGEDYYASSPASNPVGPVDGTKKVYRGGGYASNIDEINPAARFSSDPNEHAADLGFRCVLTGFDTDGLRESGSAPSCKVLPVNAQPVQAATITPIPCQPASIQAPCIVMKDGNPWLEIIINQSGCETNRLEHFESNTIADFKCADEKGGAYHCLGINLAQGATYDLSYCHTYNYFDNLTDCPSGYEYVATSGFCEPTGDWLPDPPCPITYIEVNGQCWPDYDYHPSGCPDGFLMNSLLVGPNQVWTKVCIPTAKCLWGKDAPESCNMVCPEGQTYDSDKECCSKAENLDVMCPVGLSFVQSAKGYSLCDADPYILRCENRSVTLGICPTLTPTPTPTTPPPSSGNNCGSFDKKNCEVNGCTWVKVLDKDGYCQ